MACEKERMAFEEKKMEIQRLQMEIEKAAALEKEKNRFVLSGHRCF